MQTLEVEPLGRLSWEFRVTAAGRELTTLSLTRLRDRGAFQLDGVDHTVTAEGFLQRTYRLERGGLTVARAEPRGVLRPAYAVTLGDRVVTLRPQGFLGTRYKVEHGRTPLGEIRRTGVFSRRLSGELDERIGTAGSVFLVCIATLQWRRQSRRSS